MFFNIVFLLKVLITSLLILNDLASVIILFFFERIKVNILVRSRELFIDIEFLIFLR